MLPLPSHSYVPTPFSGAQVEASVLYLWHECFFTEHVTWLQPPGTATWFDVCVGMLVGRSWTPPPAVFRVGSVESHEASLTGLRPLW